MRVARWRDRQFKKKGSDLLANDIFRKNTILSEMGPYGSIGAHIRTGERYMAHNHFQTPPDPKKVYKN